MNLLGVLSGVVRLYADMIVRLIGVYYYKKWNKIKSFIE